MHDIPSPGMESLVDAGLVLILIIPLWLALALFFDLRAYRFLRDHPEVDGKHSMEFLRGRCALLIILLGVMAGLALWRFFPHSLQHTVNLKAETISVDCTQLVSRQGSPEEISVAFGPLDAQEAAPILTDLNGITLRQDFRNLLPTVPKPDNRLDGGRLAHVILTGSDGTQQTLTFHSTHQLLISSDGQTRHYRFYDPRQAERLLTTVWNFAEKPLTPQQLQETQDYFGVSLPGGGRNRACHLFSAYYEDPRRLPVADFVRWQDGYPITGSDLRIIADLGYGELLDDGELFWTRVPRANAESILNQYTGLVLSDLENWEGTIYDGEQECFYCPFTGKGLRGFCAGSGTINRDTVTLYTDCDVLTLRRDGDRWLIQSFLPLTP